METMIGKKVIIRANRAGVFFGTLKDKVSTPAGVEVELENSRRRGTGTALPASANWLLREQRSLAVVSLLSSCLSTTC